MAKKKLFHPLWKISINCSPTKKWTETTHRYIMIIWIPSRLYFCNFHYNKKNFVSQFLQLMKKRLNLYKHTSDIPQNIFKKKFNVCSVWLWDSCGLVWYVELKFDFYFVLGCGFFGGGWHGKCPRTFCLVWNPFIINSFHTWAYEKLLGISLWLQ